MMNRFARRITGLYCLASLSACYGFYAPDSARLTGRDLEFMLTDSGSVMLASRVGPAVEAVDGRLLTDTAGVYSMAVQSTRRRDGLENGWRGELVQIPHPFVASVAERRFSPARTTLFAGAMTAALVALKSVFAGAGGSNSPGGIPGGPNPR
ncbi:MAG TPA: hypothetical protein VJ865_03335 [Gemmatimonadaceae bacterium]|nr:hypothetical protein [Gemmatimonadaceae bacterium]